MPENLNDMLNAYCTMFESGLIHSTAEVKTGDYCFL